MDFVKNAKKLVSQMTLEEKISQMQYAAPAIERLGIPAYNWWNECLHGVARAGIATVFPQPIGMAATFNEQLLKNVGIAVSDEARAKYNEYKKFGYTDRYQGITFWSPNINIFRDPRWGRGHETYGEDPYLTGVMASAFIQGLQGNGKYRKVDATLKHYAVHSGPESMRHGFNAIVNDKDLYETYLWAFRYCIEHADPSAVMGAYNRVNGEACCAGKRLLQDILYNEFGFKGYVVSDCGAICDIHENHKITSNETESAALAVNAGCQLNCGKAYVWLKQAVLEGLVTEDVITSAVERLYEARFRLGMFSDDCEYDDIPYDVIECDEHTALNRKIATESIVLLKNNGILPLKNTVTIAVIGKNSDSRDVLLGNYNGTPSNPITLLQGIRNGSNSRVLYSRGYKLPCDSDSDWPEAHPENEALITASHADVIILCTGLTPDMEGEEGDAYSAEQGGDKQGLELPCDQLQLLKALKKTGKPIICVNVSGSCVNLSEFDKECDAVLQCFYPGAEGGNALADIIFGKVSPSGRLPITFYSTVDDLPAFENYSMEGRTYKFFKGVPVYPFGYGLTYSEIEENWINSDTVELVNKGEYDTSYSVLKFEYIPHKNLCGIKKVFIKSGETLKINFN